MSHTFLYNLLSRPFFVFDASGLTFSLILILKVQQHLAGSLLDYHLQHILFTIGMKLGIYQHLICGEILKRQVFSMRKILGLFFCHVLDRYVSVQTELQIGPRFPLFGGWRTYFMIGYNLPLADYLFVSEGTRFLNFSFGSPVKDLVVDEIIVEVLIY